MVKDIIEKSSRAFLNAIFVLRVNEVLAKKLIKGFVIDKLTPEEEAECIGDVVAQSANIILGNSISTFNDIKYIVSIGPL